MGGRGGRGGERGRGGRGRGGPRPDTAGRGGRDAAVQRLDADGNPIKEEHRGNREHRGRNAEHEGKDRQDGTGRARRERKEGGDYRKKGTEGAEGEVVEEVKVEEPKVKVPEVVYEVIGESLDDFRGANAANFKEERKARDAEGIKGVKTVGGIALNTAPEVTKIVKAYATHNIVAGAGADMMGFGAVKNDDDVVFEERDSGRGGGERESGARVARQNPKQALKKTEEDFPTL